MAQASQEGYCVQCPSLLTDINKLEDDDALCKCTLLNIYHWPWMFQNDGNDHDYDYDHGDEKRHQRCMVTLNCHEFRFSIVRIVVSNVKTSKKSIICQHLVNNWNKIVMIVINC